MKRCRIDISPGAAVLFPLLYFLDGSGWFSAVLPAVIFHECGHCIAAWSCGGRILSLRMDMTGLCLNVTPFSSPFAEALCAAAGPLCGLLWAAACSALSGAWWMRCREISLYFSFCNLLPAQPLDGGRILYALCGGKTTVRIVSICTGVGCLVLALLLRRWGLALPGAWILLAQLTA